MQLACRFRLVRPRCPLHNVCKLHRMNLKVKQHTHPTDILEERFHNSILEGPLVVVGPVDPHRRVLWEVMDAEMRE